MLPKAGRARPEKPCLLYAPMLHLRPLFLFAYLHVQKAILNAFDASGLF